MSSLSKFGQLQPCVIPELVNERVLDWLVEHPGVVRTMEQQVNDEIHRVGEIYLLDMMKSVGLYEQIVKYKNIPLASRPADGSTTGTRLVHFDFAHKAETGRLYARGPSLQTFPHKIRHALTYGVLSDLDLENAHPRILSALCVENGIAHPMLADYIQNRELRLAALARSLKVDRSIAKRLVLKVMYGGGTTLDNRKFNDRWLNALKKEFRTIIVDGLVGKRESPYYAVYQKVKTNHRIKNPKFSALSRLANHVENWALGIMAGVAQGQGVQLHCLNFDGCMPPATCPPGLVAAMTAALGAHPEVLEIQLPVHHKHIPEITIESLSAEYRAFLNVEEPQMLFFSDPVYEVESEDEEYVPEPPKFLDVDIMSLVEELIVLVAGMGEGKTRTIMRYVNMMARLHNTSVVFVTQRTMMVNTLSEALHTHFDDESKALLEKLDVIQEGLEARGITVSRYDQIMHRIQPGQHQILLIEWESLHRLEPGKYDIVINDEFRSIISTMNSSTNGLRKEMNHFRYNELIQQADKVIYSCADLTMDNAGKTVIDEHRKARASRRVDACIDEANAAEARGEDDRKWTEAAKAARNPLAAKWIEPKLFRIKRRVMTASDEELIWRMRVDTLKGRRVEVCCLSKKTARLIRDMLKGYVPGSVGLYTSDSGTKQALVNLSEEWDRHQVIIFTPVLTTGASYESVVYRVYMFPCTMCATPRDMSQMGVRFRKVQTNQLCLAIGDHQIDDTLTEETLAKMYEDELNRVREYGVALRNGSEAVQDRVRLSVGPDHVYDVPEPINQMQCIAAYNNVETSFTFSMERWLQMAVYKFKRDQYTIEPMEFPEDEDFETEIDNIKERVIGMRAESKREDEAELALLDVSGIVASTDDMATLTAMASGRRVRQEIEERFTYKYAPIFGGVDRRVLVQALRKARVVRLFPAAKDFEMGSLVQMYEGCKSQMTNYETLRDPEKLARMAGFIKDAKANRLLECERPHPYPVMLALEGLVSGIGLKSVRDTTTIVDASRIDENTCIVGMQALKTMGVAVQQASSTFMAVKRVLKDQLGMVVKSRSACEHTVAMKKLFRAGIKFPSADEWFRVTYKEDAPVADAYKPTASMGTERLHELRGAFKKNSRFEPEVATVERYMQLAKEREAHKRRLEGPAKKSSKKAKK